MASYEKMILVFTDCDARAMSEASSPAMTRLLRKGVLLNNVFGLGDARTSAATGAEDGGETLWDAATANHLVVSGLLTDPFDLAVLEGGASANELENTLAQALYVAGRTTLIAVVGSGAVVFHGPGFAKGKVIDKRFSPTCVAPTVAYVANFPVPAQCEGAVAYSAFSDINLKLKAINKLHAAIRNMVGAIEDEFRPPFTKRDMMR